MVLSKRERVFRTIDIDGEPDMIPIHYGGFEQTAITFQKFLKSDERKENITSVQNKFSKLKYDITEQVFWNVDIHAMDPFYEKLKFQYQKAPPKFPGCKINPISGKIYKKVKQIETGLDYIWYIDGYFTSPEILYSYWDRFGRPSKLVNDKINYSPQIWEGFVEVLSPYFYPMALLPIAPHEALFEGMTITKALYYMKKNPKFIHDVMGEYARANIEVVKRFSEAGVEIALMNDDLGYKGRSIFSLANFKEFILPYYKQIYQACKKQGMLIVQHSCGYIDKNLPYMVDVGLNAIEALEPAAGVDLAFLKNTLGDRVAFIGGIDASNVLNFGTPKDIEEEVKRCIKAAARGGGYFIGPSHTLLNMPWENVLALRATIEKYRKYPLKLS
jgi:hypothetical protein